MKNSQAVILEFKDTKTDKIYTTTVRKGSDHPRSEKIIILLGDQRHLIGFNYAESSIANQDISTDFFIPERGEEHTFKPEPQNKPAAQEESFFQKYVFML